MERAATLRSTAAFVRQDFLSQASYRVRMLFSVGGLAFLVVPVYFVAEALQPTMAESIRNQGDQYFAFLLVGLAVHRVLGMSVAALPGAVSSGIRTGTLEALFTTRARVPALLAGMVAYPIMWTVCEAAILLGIGWMLGVRFVASQALAGAGIALLIVLAYLPFGVMAAAGILAVRTSGPLVGLLSGGSALLGGVYYPTHVIPSWIEHLSAVVPLTYGLRALRQTVLEGMPIGAVKQDIVILLVFIALLGGLAALAFARSLRYARRSGSLAQY